MKKNIRHLHALLLGPALFCGLPLTAATAPLTLGLADTPAPAADISVSGRVMDEKGEGLPGVNVLVKGTTTGTQTGVDGSYTITAPDNATLVFSYVGYTSREMTVNGRTTIDVPLVPDSQLMNDVVVVGYTTQDRQNLTSAINPVDVSQAKKAPVATITEAIQGRTSGVQIINSGTPGQGPIINIRGIGSINSSNAPLYVVDGLWTDNIRDLNPSDIESLTILKDASSTSIYGSRGANGVVIISTKKGAAGKPRISVSSYAGAQRTVDRWELTNASEWADLSAEAYRNAGLQPLAGADKQRGTFNPNVDTDWQSEILRTGTVQNYAADLSGGSTGDNYSTNFLVSGSYFKQKGALIGTGFDRYTLRLNSGLTRGRLKVTEALQLSHSLVTLPNDQPFQDAIRLLPTIPVYNPAEAPVFTAGYGYGDQASNTFGTNPVASQRIRSRTQYNDRVQGSINAEYSFFDFLSYRLNLGVESLQFTDRNARKYGRTSQNQPLDPSFLEENRGYNNFLLLENILNFNKRFGETNLNVIVGYSEQRGKNTNAFSRITGFGTGPDYNFSLSNGTANAAVGGNTFEYSKRSYFTQAVFDYKNRYLLTGSFRRDGSSRFDINNRYGNYGAGSVGWRISEEDFFKNSVPAVSNLKIRASYGVNGNDAIGEYRYQGVVNQSANYVFNGGTTVNGSIQVRLPSTGIKWESRYTTNYGFDLGLLDDRLTLSADYYTSKTKDALVSPPLPIYLGNFEGNPVTNVGDIENKGLELVASYQQTQGDFTYGVSGNLTTVRNEVLRLAEGNRPITSGVTRTAVGHPVGAFYVIPFDGIFQTQEEVNSYRSADGRVIQPYAAPGDVRYRDVNGDGQINDSDREFSDTSIPKLQYGFSANAGYKGLDLSFLFQGVSGNEIFNVAQATMDRTDDPSNFRADFTPWRPDAPSTTTPRALQGGGTTAELREAAASNARGSSRFLQDGSYLRLKNVTLGYTIPKSVVDNVKGMGSLRVYVTGQNLATFTDYNGPDPEIANGNFFERGVDFSHFPNLRTVTGGLQLSF